MKKLLLSLSLILFCFSISFAQIEDLPELSLDGCEEVCEVEKTIQIGVLLGVEIVNYQKGIGAAVIRVLDNSAAQKYSFQKLDVILAIDDTPVISMEHLVSLIQERKASDIVNVTYLRKDETFQLDVILGAKSTKIITKLVCCEDLISSFSGSNINLYPNPSQHEIHIEMKEADSGKYSFQIFNIKGQRVFNEVKEYNSSVINAINIESLPSGNYFIRLSNGIGSFTKSFIKEK